MGFRLLVSVEHAPHLGGQLGIGEGLADQVRARVEATVVDDGARGVARGKDPVVSTPLPRLIEHFADGGQRQAKVLGHLSWSYACHKSGSYSLALPLL